MEIVLGVIGGSGLYNLPAMEELQETNLETPFGATSSPVRSGRIGALRVHFIARHGEGHRLSPTEVPYRANVFAMKMLGATHLLSVSAVGSLVHEIHPGHLVLPDQIIDRTKGIRPSTFFEGGIVAHAVFADPYCADFRARISGLAGQTGAVVHDEGTLVCMEGPQFSTRAESHLYRSWGGQLVGMTALPEAKLAREAGLCYATLALATDYDCWHEGEEDVTVEAVLEVMKDNARKAREIISMLSDSFRDQSGDDCGCPRAMAGAVVTAPDGIPAELRQRLAPILIDIEKGD